MKIPLQLITATVADLTRFATIFKDAASAGDSFLVNGRPVAQMHPDGLRELASKMQKRANELLSHLNGEMEVE